MYLSLTTFEYISSIGFVSIGFKLLNVIKQCEQFPLRLTHIKLIDISIIDTSINIHPSF